jgi:hypothetical protein
VVWDKLHTIDIEVEERELSQEEVDRLFGDEIAPGAADDGT